ncbi:MAG: hypothetical protein AAFQ59_17690 [Pseudomonadota bacterium]
MKDLSTFDAAVADARAFIADHQRGDWHSVACVVQTAAGRQYVGMNLDSTLPRASVCAEPVALGMAVAADPDDRVVFCAAVNRRGEVIPPCGPCRELMLDYAADAQVAVPGGDDFVVVAMSALMPTPFKPTQRKP